MVPSGYDAAVPNPVIRSMTGDDVDAAADAILRDDWGDRRGTFAFVVAHDRCRGFVATVGRTVVGTGVVTLNGPVGWIGTIWVDPSRRRLGLGRALTEVTIDAAESAGCRTLVLVATEAGRPLYEGLGFEIQSRYVIVEAPGLAGTGAPPTPAVRAFRDGDLEAIRALDALATGEDRAHLLSAFADPGSARVLDRPDGGLGGFVVRAPWGGGATIALDPDDAMTILTARRLAAPPDGRVRAGLLSENAAGLEHLAEAGWRQVWSAPRLVRGEPLDWRPEAIWGQFNHALG